MLSEAVLRQTRNLTSIKTVTDHLQISTESTHMENFQGRAFRISTVDAETVKELVSGANAARKNHELLSALAGGRGFRPGPQCF